MARRVTAEDIKKINEIYCQCKTYSETARRTGWSVSTVRKYVDPSFIPQAEKEIRRFDCATEFPEYSTKMFEGVENLGDLCILSEEEKTEIGKLWGELSI